MNRDVRPPSDATTPYIDRHSPERERLLILLYDPLTDEDFLRGALRRFYRGDNRRELYLSLARTRETPAVVYELVRDFWQRSRTHRVGEPGSTPSLPSRTTES